MSIATNMSTISIVPKRGLFPYAIHMKDNPRVESIARQLLRCGFTIEGKRFKPKNIRSVTVTTPDGRVTPVTC